MIPRLMVYFEQVLWGKPADQCRVIRRMTWVIFHRTNRLAGKSIGWWK